MPEIDLEPGKYRIAGGRKAKRRLSDRTLRWLSYAAAIWCASAIYFYRSFFPVEPGWWAYAAGALPGFALFLWVAFTE